MAYGTTSMVTFISLLILTFIPKLPLADDTIESSFESALGSISGIKQYLAIEEVMSCEFQFEDAGRNLESAITKYQKSQFKDVVKHIDEALKSIKGCQDSSDGQFYIAESIVQDIVNLVTLINKIKKQVSSNFSSDQVLRPALSPQIAH